MQEITPFNPDFFAIMNRNQKFFVAFIVFDFIVMLVVFAAMWRYYANQEPDDGRLRVVVSIDPQACFLERIGGDRVSVEVLVPSGKEPETYTPSPDKIKKLSRSSVFFRVGFPAEQSLLPRLESIAPKLLIVDTRTNLDLRQAVPHSHDEHDAAHDHSHTVGCDCGIDGIDPHTWVSPTLVKKQAETIRDALVSLDPAGKAEYEANCEKFVAELTELQQYIREQLTHAEGKTIYVYHPTYGYFCDEFGLVQKAIEVDGKSPTPKTLADWIRSARDDEVRVIFVQPEFNRSAAEKIAQSTGAKLVAHSTLDRDYFQSMRNLADLIREAYEGNEK